MNRQPSSSSSGVYLSRAGTVIAVLFVLVIGNGLLLFLRSSSSSTHNVRAKWSSVLREHGGVVLFGDSLIRRSFEQHSLAAKIESRLQYKVGFVNEGVEADTIARMYYRVGPIVSKLLSRRLFPMAVLILWDSDVSDVNEDILNAAQIKALRKNYTTKLRLLLKKLLTTGAYIAVSGPGILGSYWKTSMLEDYREMNRQVCEELHVSYIDVRNALLEEESRSGSEVTTDGEHLNDLGTAVIAEVFAAEIEKWQRGLQRPPSLSQEQ